MSQLELQAEIQSLLSSNIMLEPAAPEEGLEEYHHDYDQEAIEPEKSLDLDSMETNVEIAEYGDYFNDDYGTALGASEVSDYDGLNEVSEAHERTLEEHLLWQLHLNTFTEREMLIGGVIIDALNEDGFLFTPFEELKNALTPLIKREEFELVLRRIQNFEPAGIAARTVAESLKLQVEALDPKPEWAPLALQLFEKGFKELEQLNLKGIMALLKIDEAQLRTLLNAIRTLNPRPGNQFSSAPSTPVVPDLFLTCEGEKLIVTLNEGSIPKLRINPYYQGLLNKLKRDSKDSEVLAEHLAEARAVIHNLGSRFDTLLRVAQAVVNYQYEYFFQGVKALRPLQLKDIAERLDYSESTISRAVAGKYMLCPTGMIALNDLFSHQISSSHAEGEEASAAAVMALLKEIVEKEPKEKPLSDARLAALLAVRGHDVARRTVAKYREQLNIPSSTERKRLAMLR